MLAKFAKTTLDINQFSQIFDAFFLSYQNETECNNKIVIKVNIPWPGA